MKFLLFSGVYLCRLQKRDCNGMVFIVVASTMVTARGVTNKTCRGKTQDKLKQHKAELSKKLKGAQCSEVVKSRVPSICF